MRTIRPISVSACNTTTVPELAQLRHVTMKRCVDRIVDWLGTQLEAEVHMRRQCYLSYLFSGAQLVSCEQRPMRQVSVGRDDFELGTFAFR